jgi:hypothetical protein
MFRLITAYLFCAWLVWQPMANVIKAQALTVPLTTFTSPIPVEGCPGIEPSDTVTNSIKITATTTMTDSLSIEDIVDFYDLQPRCPTPYHLRWLRIAPLVPGFVPKLQTWIGKIQPAGIVWIPVGWTFPNDVTACAADWHKCEILLKMGCPPAQYLSFRVEISTASTSADVAACRLYDVQWEDRWTKTYLPLITR